MITLIMWLHDVQKEHCIAKLQNYKRVACTIATESTLKSELALPSGIDMVSLEWVGDKSLGEVHEKIIIFSIITEMASPCPLYA